MRLRRRIASAVAALLALASAGSLALALARGERESVAGSAALLRAQERVWHALLADQADWLREAARAGAPIALQERRDIVPGPWR